MLTYLSNHFFLVIVHFKNDPRIPFFFVIYVSKNCSFVFLCEETRDNLLNAVAGFSKGSSSERSPISV